MKTIATIYFALTSLFCIAQKDTVYDVSKTYEKEFTTIKELDGSTFVSSRTTYSANCHATMAYRVDTTGTTKYFVALTVGPFNDPVSGTGLTIRLDDETIIKCPTAHYKYYGSKNAAGYKINCEFVEVTLAEFRKLCESPIYEIELSSGPIAYMKGTHANRAMNCAKAIWNASKRK